MEITKEEKDYLSSCLVNTVLACDSLINFTDELSKTAQYRQRLKSAAVNLREQAEKNLKENLPIFFEASEEVIQNMMMNYESYQRLMSENIRKLEHQDFIKLNQIIELYMNNKEVFDDSFNIVMMKLNSGTGHDFKK